MVNVSVDISYHINEPLQKEMKQNKRVISRKNMCTSTKNEITGFCQVLLLTKLYKKINASQKTFLRFTGIRENVEFEGINISNIYNVVL